MKKIIFLSILISFLSCKKGEDKPVENNLLQNTQHKDKGLLKYSIIDEEIVDDSLKTQILFKIVIEEKDIDSMKMKELLTSLYGKTISRTGFKYHDNPTNVFIYAYNSKHTARNSMGQWIGMISKSFYDTEPTINISKVQIKALSEVKETKWGLSYETRKQIWLKSLYVEKRAGMEADEKYPLDKSIVTEKDMRNNSKLNEQLLNRYEKEIVNEYKLKKDILDSITIEGIDNGWVIPQK